MTTGDHRRRPRQQRSRAMVERILDAAVRVLSEVGYAGMSTNRVAAEAGVSVGSLYRYFADKEEIFEELRVRAADGVFEEMATAVQAATAMPVRPGVRHVVATLVDALRARAAVTSALINEVPMGSHSNVLPETERGLAQFTRMYAAQHAPDLSGAELEARIYLAMGVTLSSCLRIALDDAAKPEGLDPEHLIDMVADLLVLGLTAPSAG